MYFYGYFKQFADTEDKMNDNMRAKFTDKACTGGKIVKVSDAEWNLQRMLYVPGCYKEPACRASGLLDDFSRLADRYDHAYDSEISNLRDIAEEILHDNEKCFYNLPNFHRQRRKWVEFYIRIWETFDTGRPWPEYGAILVPDFEGSDLIFEFSDSSAEDWLTGFEEMLRGVREEVKQAKSDIDDYVFHTDFSGGVSSIHIEIPKKDPRDFADDEFNYEVRRLTAEIEDRVKKLRAYGLDETIIESLFQQKPELSRLVVTEDFRILLPDYNGLEIKMEPIQKAVYLLFLRHPDGIMFKYLPEFRAEFESIYMSITNREDISSIQQSIDRVLDPTNNSINEKCARIRAAFISRFDDRLAKEYYITGHAGKPKKIELYRSLVKMECRIPRQAASPRL